MPSITLIDFANENENVDQPNDVMYSAAFLFSTFTKYITILHFPCAQRVQKKFSKSSKHFEIEFMSYRDVKSYDKFLKEL